MTRSRDDDNSLAASLGPGEENTDRGRWCARLEQPNVLKQNTHSLACDETCPTTLRVLAVNTLSSRELAAFMFGNYLPFLLVFVLRRQQQPCRGRCVSPQPNLCGPPRAPPRAGPLWGAMRPVMHTNTLWTFSRGALHCVMLIRPSRPL